jgi:signal transduction histidine kinase
MDQGRPALRRPSGDLSLLSLLELSQELSVRLDLYEIADAALYNLLGHFGCSRGAFWILPEVRSREPVLVRSQGITETVAKAIGGAWTRWLLDRPGELLEPLLLSELRDLGSGPDLDLAEEKGIAIFAPVTARRSLSGLVALGRRVSGNDFGSLDREILRASVNLLGVSVENTNVYNRAIENNRRLRMANEQLQELDRLKSEFLRNMNHELRTPLTIIIAYLDSILGMEEEGTRRDHLKVIRSQTTKLHGMLLQLLDFGKLLQDRLTIDVQRGDVREALMAFYEDRRPGISADLREFKFSAASTPTPALFERERLLQIVDCLVDNAVKFSPQGSHVHLRVDLESVDGVEWVRVDVADDGPGIEPERLPVIFESFRQGDGSQTREHGGLGIGLAFAKSLAEKMDGHLEAASTPGQGSVFSLWLPAA